MLETLVMVIDAMEAPPPRTAPPAPSARRAAADAPMNTAPGAAAAPQSAPAEMNAAPGRPSPAAPAAPQAAGGFGALLRRAQGGAAPGRGGDIGAALDDLSALSRPGGSARRRPAPPRRPAPDAPQSSAGRRAAPDPQEELARLLIRAMLQAAKSDGRIDREERGRIIERMGRPGHAEMEFLQAEMDRPVDLPGLVSETPEGAEAQVYMMSLLAIRLDEQSEAQYLHGLAQGLGLDPAAVNAIHQRLGAPPLYR
ncbi:tellurite resistance TerB family protein [Frigidibacter sp. ROC022]|uniref:tellurite resistance TerB family protein n=1 Tax=Frigidibacter sp. ROC022 TaxID=2971796 RepID=UPI00215A79FE|nr:tellurite resistance TerB family protein [Frigidibacter sp. ROC022]MCR8723661.1 tellurite resistance TerB family protein [Frigidibacter sp. ROC022]